MVNPNTETSEKQTQYIMPSEIESNLLDGCQRIHGQDLLECDKLIVSQLLITGPGSAEDYPAIKTRRMLYVLDGKATGHWEATETEINQGDLIIVPGGTPWGSSLQIISEQLTLLSITQRFNGVSGNVKLTPLGN